MNNDKLISTYKDLVKYFTNIAKTSKDAYLITFAKDSVKDFVNQLYVIEKGEKEIYERMLEEVNIEKDKLVSIDINENNVPVENNTEDNTIPTENPTEDKGKEEPKDYTEYINNLDENIKQDLKKLEDKLIEDLKNPNDALIDTWVKNFKDYVTKNNLEEKYMIDFMKNIFINHDKDKKYVDNIEEIYKNGEIKNKENKEPENTETKTDDPKTPENKEPEKGEEELGNEPLKIVNRYTPTYSKGEKIGMGVLAIACLSTPFITPAVIVGFMAHRVMKNYKYRNKELINYIKENGFDIDTSKNELVDAETRRPITEQEVGKAQYETIRKQLLDIGVRDHKKDNPEYMKNRLLSIFMKSKTVRRIVENSNKKKEQQEKYDNSSSYLERQEIKRGMGRF